MLNLNRRKLAQLSRDTSSLVKISIGLVAISLVISAVISAFGGRPEQEGGEDVGFERLSAIIRNSAMGYFGMDPGDFRNLDFREASDPDTNQLHESFKHLINENESIDQSQRDLLTALSGAVHGSDSARREAVLYLQSLPGEMRFRNEFLGDALIASGEPEKAIEAYIKEGERYPDATYSQRSAIVALTERKEIAPLRTVLEKPGFRKSLPPVDGIEAATVLGSQKGLFAEILRMEIQMLKSPYLVTAIFTAAIWFIILLSMGSLNARQAIWGTAAFAMGIFAAVLTLYVVYLQEEYLNLAFHPDDTLVNQAIALVAGVGLREETLKLLCFLPLAIAILPIRNAMLALILAGLTGLGFAMMENLHYFVNSNDQFIAWTRLLSANALHFCLTGIAGFSLYQLLRNKGHGWENFLVDFLFVVVVHGIFNAFHMIPMFGEYGIVSLVVLALTAYRYLDLVRDHMTHEGQLRKISPLGVFVVGTALLGCGIMIVTSVSHTFLQSAGAFASTIGGSLPIAFAFISRLRDL
ncbi:MAG: PrsW family glutamic-type intramembrane protease [Verrucomicrobiales bacterium]|nr:PrsW family glutamic-type intramembrane protease [Verrucomicrobiales bacterium]